MSRVAEALKWAAAERPRPNTPAASPHDQTVFAPAWDVERPGVTIPGAAPDNGRESRGPASPSPGPTEKAGDAHATGGDGRPASHTGSSSTDRPTPSIRLESQLAQSWPQPFPAEVADKLVVMRGMDGAAVRSYLQLAAALQQKQLEWGARSVLITSARVGEGKTLTAVNLALVFSSTLHAKRVLLVDAHLRQPRIHELLQISLSPGLAGCLASSGRHLPLVGVTGNLAILPAGRPGAQSAALLGSDRMREILSHASEAFEWVVIDGPPVLGMPDACVLAGLADLVILVVQGRTTRRHLIEQAAEALHRDRITGAVLNRLPRMPVRSPGAQ